MKQMCTFLLIRIKIRNDNARNRRRKSPTQPSTYLYTFHGAEYGRARLIACTKIFRQSWGALGIEKKCIAHVISFFDFFLLVFSLSLSLSFTRHFSLCVCVLWVHAQHHARDSTPHKARSRHERNHKKDNNNNRDDDDAMRVVLVFSPNNGL